MDNDITLNEYYFQGVRFVPGYNDFDYDDCKVNATNEKEAWELLDKYTKMFTWKSVVLTHINDQELEETSQTSNLAK